jgi:GTP cyclohydrolase IB
MFEIDRGELPDISKTLKTAVVTTLNKVGMSRIEMPVLIETEGQKFRAPAKVDAFVSLDQPQAKGIHMSRLYRELRNSFNSTPLSWKLLKETLEKFLITHHDLSLRSFVRVELELPVERQALVSGERGWRQYPVVLSGKLQNGTFEFAAEIKVLYSSTCPCSAALARQLVGNQFKKDFGQETHVATEEIFEWLNDEKSIVAVPHAQRSEAFVKIKFNAIDKAGVQMLPEILATIDLLEKTLGTPVQAAVKRSDEQEFARLNGENLMFCEDAGRKLKAALEGQVAISDYYVRVAHQESLHPHDAVAIAVKGVAGGYTEE